MSNAEDNNLDHDPNEPIFKDVASDNDASHPASGIKIDEGNSTEVVLAKRVEELEAALADMKDKAMRALAEAENTRKRSEREKLDTSKFAIGKFAKDLLEVADNMRRAVQTIPAEAKEESDLIKNIIIGVEATEKSMLSAFERNGIKLLAPTEGKFDPNYHEAMFEAEDPSKQAGDIIQLIEPGFVLHDRLLRPARVGVAKGAPLKAQNVDEKA